MHYTRLKSLIPVLALSLVYGCAEPVDPEETSAAAQSLKEKIPQMAAAYERACMAYADGVEYEPIRAALEPEGYTAYSRLSRGPFRNAEVIGNPDNGLQVQLEDAPLTTLCVVVAESSPVSLTRAQQKEIAANAKMQLYEVATRFAERNGRKLKSFENKYHIGVWINPEIQFSVQPEPLAMLVTRIKPPTEDDDAPQDNM